MALKGTQAKAGLKTQKMCIYCHWQVLYGGHINISVAEMDFCIFLFFCFRNLSSSGCSHVGLLFGRKRLASDECALLPHRPAVFMTSQSQSKWQHSQQLGLCVVVVLQPSNIDLNNLTMFQASNCCECCFHSVPVDRTFDASSLKVALSLSLYPVQGHH